MKVNIKYKEKIESIEIPDSAYLLILGYCRRNNLKHNVTKTKEIHSFSSVQQEKNNAL